MEDFKEVNKALKVRGSLSYINTSPSPPLYQVSMEFTREEQTRHRNSPLVIGSFRYKEKSMTPTYTTHTLTNFCNNL